MDRQRLVLKSETQPRCPGCWDSIAEHDEVVSCSHGHAVVHVECVEMVPQCSVIGCQESLLSQVEPQLIARKGRRQLSQARRFWHLQQRNEIESQTLLRNGSALLLASLLVFLVVFYRSLISLIGPAQKLPFLVLGLCLVSALVATLVWSAGRVAHLKSELERFEAFYIR